MMVVIQVAVKVREATGEVTDSPDSST